MLLHFTTGPFIAFFVPRLLDELQHIHRLQPHMAPSLVQNQIIVRAYWKDQNTTTCWKIITVLVVIMLKLQPMTPYFIATLCTAVIDWIWQMARHQQTTNHSSVVQYDTIFISHHSITWWTEKPSPPPCYGTYFTLYISLHVFYIALPLIFQHSQKLKANTFLK